MSVVFCFFCAPVGVWKKRCTLASGIMAVAAWTFAVVEGSKSYLSSSRLKLVNNNFYHCFSSSCSCNFHFCHTCHTSTLSHVLERPVLTGTVWKAGAVQARVTPLFFGDITLLSHQWFVSTCYQCVITWNCNTCFDDPFDHCHVHCG